ncbi:MAG: metal-dependent hydrolase [Nevskiales bacterium]
MRKGIERTPAGHQVVPRSNLDFGFDGDIPRFWFAGDPFKTRFFDSMSTLFPEGERFFIECVRDYRDQVTDPELKQQVTDFIYQEGQHGMQHNRFNARLAQQGIRVDYIEERNRKVIGWWRKWMPKKLTLAITAAAEHLTAIMAHAFLGNRELFTPVDSRMRALYFWHAIEEIEHKAVAFDVMKRVARVDYFTRIFGMIFETIFFPFFTFLIMNHMFKTDGVRSRVKVWLKGLWWLYGPGGIMIRLLPHYLRYYLPGFHPWQTGHMAGFDQWRKVYRESGNNPIAASNALMALQFAVE